MNEDEKWYIPPTSDVEEWSPRWAVVAILVGASAMIVCCVCGIGIVVGGQLT